MEYKDYYAILGVDKTVPKQILKGLQKACQKYHRMQIRRQKSEENSKK